MSTIHDQYSSTQPSTQTQYQSPRSGGGSNCLWIALPVGCLAILLIGCGGIFGLGYFGYRTVVDNAVSADATFEKVKNDPRTQAIMGTPITKKMGGSFSSNYNNGKQTSRIRFEILGPNGKADVEAEATKDGEEWTYTRLVLQPQDSEEEVDLLESVMDAAMREVDEIDPQ